MNNKKAWEDEYYEVLNLFEEYTANELGEKISGAELARRTSEDHRKKPGERENIELEMLEGFYKWLQRKKNFTCEESFRNLKRMTNFLNNNLRSRLIDHCIVLSCSDCFWGAGQES